ncbi:MAG TPA: hypothetical protein EYP61_05370 [Candidatus Latescibacteria bacterium]|nr:hypothetical protein [Candidatus Latescibacterota bacterium]
MMRKVLLWLLALGCSYYSFSGGGLPPYIRTVSVPPFEPGEVQVVVPGMEEELARAVVDTLLAGTSLKVVGGGADAVLEGKVVSVREEPFTYTPDEMAKQWRLSIILRIRFEDVVKHKVLWEDELTVWGVYKEGEGREGAMEEAKRMLAEEVAGRMLGGW